MNLKKYSMGVALWAVLAVGACGGSNAVTDSTTAPVSSTRLSASVKVVNTVSVPPTDSNLTYIGRWDKSDSTTYRSYWGGAYVTTKFTGTTAKVKLTGPVYFRFIIDGALANYSPSNRDRSGIINLTPTPLADGTHTLKVIADINGGQLPFMGLVLDEGASTVAPAARPLVEFIGDSITSGHSTSQGPVTDFAWLTGEALGAEHTQIAFSGITLVDGHHYPDNHWPGMESIYLKLKTVLDCLDVACTTNPAWSFSNYTAKVVVINLGTNDQNLGADSTSPADFQSRYTAFLQNIRAKYPNADIFVMRTFNGYYQTQIQAAVNARSSAGDTKVHYINTDGWLIPAPSPDFADLFHPTDAGHVKIANRLVPILQPYLTGP
jgi:lysophospholipase L1-like esterase